MHAPVRTRDLLRAASAALLRYRDPRAALEAHLRNAYAADHVALCGSGTQALRLALRAARQQAGNGAVALPAYTCFDVAAAAVAEDFPIVLYDVEPGTLAPDMDGVRRAFAQGARVLVVAPLFGLSPDWEALCDCAAEHGAMVIEDAAQGHGASWRGRALGSWLPVSILSFARGKGWTGGRGGVLLLRGGAVPSQQAGPTRLSAELRVLLEATAQRVLGTPALYALPSAMPGLGLGETSYRAAAVPVRLTRAAATLLTGSRQVADEEAAARRRMAAWWEERIQRRHAVRTVVVHPEATAGYLRYPVRLAAGLNGWTDAAEAARLGLAPVYPTTLSALPEVHRRLTNAGDAWPGAEELATHLATLPTHSRLTNGERAQLLNLVNAYAT